MKKCAGLCGGLAALFILGTIPCLPAWSQSFEADYNPAYGSYDSFDPSEDFSGSPPPPARRARTSAPAVDLEAPASGRAAAPQRGSADIPDLRTSEEYPPATEFVDPEPVAEESPPPVTVMAAEPEPTPPAVNAAAPPPAVPDPALSATPLPAAAVDYSKAESWLARPQSADRAVDIFYVYPGVCGRAGSGGALCPAGDPSTRQRAENQTQFQAGVFAPIGNVYVPFYRQANSALFMGLAAQDRESRLLPSAADVAAAFDYYVRNYNNGRPFILAAHGQGSAAVIKGILGDYLRANPEARSRMVAAYVLGYSVTSDFLSQNDHLRFAERRDDLGVIISYTTETPDMRVPNPVILPRAVAINPVNWSRSARKAAASLSQGANLGPFEGEDQVKDFADARVNLRRGAVECSTVPWDEKYLMDGFPSGTMPAGDYAFYYYDLRRNAQERVDAYMLRRGQ